MMKNVFIAFVPPILSAAFFSGFIAGCAGLKDRRDDALSNQKRNPVQDGRQTEGINVPADQRDHAEPWVSDPSSPKCADGKPEPLPKIDEASEYKHTLWPNGQINEEWNEIKASGGQEVRHGIWRQWYEDCRIKEERNYVNGVLRGKHTQWYTNGQKILERNFINGEESGTRTMWTREGAVEFQGDMKERQGFSGVESGKN